MSASGFDLRNSSIVLCIIFVVLHHFRIYAVLHFASFFVNLSKIGHFQLVNLAHSKLMIVVDSRSCDVEKVHKRLKQFPDFFSVDF